MIFTDEQFQKLKIAEPHFESSKSGWVRNATREVMNLTADIYFEATGQKIPKTWSCSICVINLFKRVGMLYFKDKEEREELSKASIELEPIATDEAEEVKTEEPVAKKNSKKNGRKIK